MLSHIKAIVILVVNFSRMGATIFLGGCRPLAHILDSKPALSCSLLLSRSLWE